MILVIKLMYQLSFLRGLVQIYIEILGWYQC
jgi:hypothetical protein